MSANFQSVCPGVVKTEILFASGFKMAEGLTVEELYSNMPHLECQDICDAIIYILGTPPHVQVWLTRIDS
jgi:NADP-dependent 3-hydroxy acid dehydrogenase YdfG